MALSSSTTSPTNCYFHGSIDLAYKTRKFFVLSIRMVPMPTIMEFFKFYVRGFVSWKRYFENLKQKTIIQCLLIIVEYCHHHHYYESSNYNKAMCENSALQSINGVQQPTYTHILWWPHQLYANGLSNSIYRDIYSLELATRP